jgi:hypothetical protein
MNDKTYYLVSWSDDRFTSYDWVSIEEIQKYPNTYKHSRCTIYQKVDIEQLLKKNHD